MNNRNDQLTGRGPAEPGRLLREQIFEPQFRHEARHLLSFCVLIEKVLLLEYRRMGLMSAVQVNDVARLLHQVSATQLTADPEADMADLTSALEKYVIRNLPDVAATWHMDRSHNDTRACAQMLFGRDMVYSCASTLLTFGAAAHRLAAANTEHPMPGHSPVQAGQVISPGFYVSAISGQVLRTLERLGSVYNAVDSSPLGSGAMSGQELSWDRERMARLLGCQRVQPHALTSVASRGWALEAAAEFSILGVELSRFATDLMAWGNEYGFIDLPDELSGRSPAMPRRTFPVLERIRGRTAHLTAFYVDLTLVQRNTPFTDSVEVSREPGTGVVTLFDTVQSTLAMFTAVLDNMVFLPREMREACEREYLGGSTLANLLTLRAGIPWRDAQVVAEEYIAEAIQRGLPPSKPDPALLKRILAEFSEVDELTVADLLTEAFDVGTRLTGKRTSGSTHPNSVRQILDEQATQFDQQRIEWQTRHRVRCEGLAEIDRQLGLGDKTDVSDSPLFW